MFDFVRQHSKLMLGLIVLLIIPSFVFFGIDGYQRMTDGANATVAEVAGQKITQAEWDLAQRRAVETMRQRVPGAEASLFDTPEFRRQALEQLVRERLLLAAAYDQHLVPTQARLPELVKSSGYFAPLRGPDGQVDRDRALQAGFGDAAMEQQIALRYGMDAVLGGVSSSAQAAPAVANAALDALLQQREVQVQAFDAGAYRAKVQPTDGELEAWHKSHAEEFRAPEQAQIEWVMLDLATLAKDVAVPEGDLKAYYEQNAERYTQPEERQARHILVKAEREAPAAEREKARAKAEQLLSQARAKPGDFAALAKANSDDPGSAAEGGDLGFFGRGAMVKPFEDAAFALKPGEISPVVESDFGYHVIQLEATRGGEKRPFDEVRGEIEQEVRRSLAQRRYAEAAEQFSNMVYEQPESLQPVIDRFKLEKRTATVQRQPAPGGEGPLATAKLLDAVFGDDALRQGRNTDAVETGPNQLVSARVVKHEPERVLPLAEVRDQVRERVVAEQAAALAKKDAEARLAALREAKDGAGLPAAVVVSRAQTQGLPRPVVEAALKADPKAVPSLQLVDLGTAGQAVLRVGRVLPRDPAAGGGDAPLREQFAQALGNAEAEAYYKALEQRYKVVIKAKDPAKP
ncbi:peptidylprolyl isomerase [Rubrivivax albus]|uniref:Periplasmic chaperone PpiD n=1 Tax=Rubrivivax albus TaxID=2499835 RepID=A0A437K0T8_9BURK|nr:peptidylprolyl isomerase [Rubrivivax albus]RVT53875.1 peptidyl-prolyl cis-trans isomerase [Rubrivivax albus]